MKKNKLILTMYIAVLSLLVASVSMSAAWFVASRTLYVNSINISFDADRELEISESKDDGYSDHVDYNESEIPAFFIPITSAHSSLWTSQDVDGPIFYDETVYSTSENFTTYKQVTKGNGYFSKKYYIKADDDLLVTIDPDNTFIEANTEYNANQAVELHDFYQNTDEERYEKYKSLSVDDIYTRLNRIVLAMRFSIFIKDEMGLTYTIIDPNYEQETVMGGLLDNASDQYYDSYRKDGTEDYYERVYGEYEGTPVYDEPLAHDSDYFDPNDLPSAFNARHKKSVKLFNETKSKSENGFEFKKEGAINLDDFKNDKKPFHFPVKMDEPKEVIISIYIEGWDLDSVNYTMGAAFKSNLTFKIERTL